jgi:hypothetical protein
VTVDPDRLIVRAIGELTNGELSEIERFDRESHRVSGPIVVAASST